MQDDPIQELRFEDLDAQKQEEIQINIKKARTAINAATEFLNTAPQQFSGASYGTDFEEGALDNHKMDEYLFKFACAIVSDEWERLEAQS